MPKPDRLIAPTPEVWPTFQVDTALQHDFDLIDVKLPRVGRHLADRGVAPAVIGDHTLALMAAPDNQSQEVGGRYMYKQARVDLYPEAAIGFALAQYMGEATQANNWQRPLKLARRTKTTLDYFLTHELQHVVDFTEPGAYEAATAYHRGTSRMLRRYAYRSTAGAFGCGTVALTALEGVYHLNPETPSVLMSLGTLMAWAAWLPKFMERMQIFRMALQEVRYNNNPFESQAVAAEGAERGNFFTVELSSGAKERAREVIDQYRTHVLRK